MATIRSLCVYCGSSTGDDPAYAEAARALGTLLAQEGITLVYGGGQVGLMGEVSRAALAAGGRVHGVIPEALATKEVAAVGLTEIEVVPNMHIRKARMAELSDGFVVLPGGLGTLEELFETWTWGQLGWHEKPIGMIDVMGFYEPLLKFISNTASSGFMSPVHQGMLQVAETPGDVLSLLRDYVPPAVKKYVGRKDL